MRILPLTLGARLLACALSMPMLAMASDPRGYQSTDSVVAIALPAQVVLAPQKVRAEIAPGGAVAYFLINANGHAHLRTSARSNSNSSSNFASTAGARAPRMPVGVGVGASIAGGVIGEAFAEGMQHEQGVDAAKLPYETLRSSGCDLDLSPISDAVKVAVGTAWPGMAVQFHGAEDPDQATRQLDMAASRYAFVINSSLSPDFSALVTTVDAAAYPVTAGATQAVKDPAWHDRFYIVSDEIALLPKTQADIDQLVADENARFDALNLGPTIQMLNKASENGDYSSHRDDRNRVRVLLQDHRRALSSANASKWGLSAVAQRNARILSANQCTVMKDAVNQSATVAADAIAALAHGTLPPRLDKKATNAPSATSGQRALTALPDGDYVSERGGDTEPLYFTTMLLKDQDLGPQ